MHGHGASRPTYTGHHVLDERGDDVGRVVDVIYTDPDTTDDGSVVIPWEKRWVKSAPKATGDHLLSHDQVSELERHYALT